MASKTLNAKIKQRIDTTANWTTNSTVVLENGELGFERTISGEIKFKIGDGQKKWLELSYINNTNGNNNSTTYNAGPGIKIENDTISSIYGTSILQDYVLNSSTANPSMIFNLDIANEDFKLNSFTYLIPNNQIEFIQYPFTIIFKENNSQISSLNISLSTKTLWPNTEQEVSFENSDAGSIIFAQVVASEGKDTESINILTDENSTIPISDWWVSNIMSINDAQYLYISAHEDILPLTIDEIELQIQLPTIQKIPSQALSAQNGVKIGTNGEIELDYDSATHIPYMALNGNNNTDSGITASYDYIDNPAEAIVLGSNNSYFTRGNNLLVIGSNNTLNNSISYSAAHLPQLVVGNYLSDYSGGYDNPLILLGQYNNVTPPSIGGIPYMIIGNGQNDTGRSNLIEVTSSGVNINGDLFINGINNNDYITSNDLSNFLNNNNYINRLIDDIPTLNSDNLITSNGVYASINEIMQVANGKTACYVFDTVSDMNNWLNMIENKASLHTGDVFLIRALDVPDYWWDATTNNGNGGTQILETTKVDLTNYALASAIPTNNNQLTNGAGYITSSALTIDNIDVGDYLIISGGNASSFTLT